MRGEAGGGLVHLVREDGCVLGQVSTYHNVFVVGRSLLAMEDLRVELI